MYIRQGHLCINTHLFCVIQVVRIMVIYTRLVGGSYPWEGRVEIFLSSQWGTITDPVWTSDDAQVICRKLGHFKPGIVAILQAIQHPKPHTYKMHNQISCDR